MPDMSDLQRLMDRQAISDCLAAYCRGVDRMDIDILRQAYHPDAYENHGGAMVGSFEDFLEWLEGPYQDNLVMSHHSIHNHSCDLDGDVAHTETYCSYIEIRSNPHRTRRVGGRYVDRFERRDGRWGIANRCLIIEWIVAAPGAQADPWETYTDRPLSPEPRRDRLDKSYMRPLIVTPAG